MNSEKKEYLINSIRGIPDFPHKGILFHDVTTLLLDPKVRNFEISFRTARKTDQNDSLETWAYQCTLCFSMALQAFKWSVDDFVERYKDQSLDVIVGEGLEICVNQALSANQKA